MLQFPRWKVDVTVGGNVVKTFYETATTSAAALAKAKHKMRGAVSSAGAFKFKATKAEAGESARRHATKKSVTAPKSQRASKPKEKRLHFAGYDFTSGPEGTVVHRPTPELPGFRPGDRVEYRDVNLWQQGTVTGSDGKWIMVRWDGKSFVSREWAPNLRHVSTGSSARHATKKKTPAQLDREIAEALSRPKVHLLKTRGGTECGEPGKSSADINWVTCEKCLRSHEALERSAQSHATKKQKKARIVHVEANTPAGYRWLRTHARGATVTAEGFAVTDEREWAQSLAAAGALEIPSSAGHRSHATKKAASANGDAAGIADQLTERDRSTLAWVIENWPWPYRGQADADMARLHALGLVETTTGDTWGGATALGRAVWARARKTWIDEHSLGAAFRRKAAGSKSGR
jgi:hypothetical protein